MVPPGCQLREGRAQQRLGQAGVRADARSIALGDHLLHLDTLKEGAHVVGDGVVTGRRQPRVQPAHPEVLGGLGGHARILPCHARPLASTLAELQRAILRGALDILDHCKPPRKLPAAGLELHQEYRKRLHKAVALFHNVVLRTVDPRVMGTVLAKQQLAEEHEATAPRVADRDIGILGKILALPVRLSATPGGVKAPLRERVHVLLRRAMPAVDNVGGAAKVAGQVVGRGPEEAVDAPVPNLPGAKQWPGPPSLRPARLQELHLGP
mmetsp:Transcript_44174/g.126056  ORF Transcript_44174/g.126056 Transcript_44174/m.126056 type:complete len:267 (-) Transcript_44174:289-1089(-)